MKATGFSHIEILVALVIFQLAALTVLQGHWRARQQVVVAQQELTAIALLSDIAATLQQLPSLPDELQRPLTGRLPAVDNRQQQVCSPTQQALQVLQPILARVFDQRGFAQAQLCIAGDYPTTELNFSWASQWRVQRDIGQGLCHRHGAFHQVQIKLRRH